MYYFEFFLDRRGKLEKRVSKNGVLQKSLLRKTVPLVYQKARMELLVKICELFKDKLCSELGENSLGDGIYTSFSHTRTDLIIGIHLSFFDHAKSPLKKLKTTL